MTRGSAHRSGRRRGMTAAAVLLAGGALITGGAGAQGLSSYIIGGGGGTSTGGGYKHFGLTGAGMAIGRNAGGGVVGRHGFLAGASRIRDDIPPEFVPHPPDIRVSTAADRCAASVAFPAITAVDNRDRNPTVTATLMINPPRALNLAGEQIELGVGSYDVRLVATDRYGNEARSSFRVDVVDEVPPRIEPLPNPTPVGNAIEATSPLGTPVDLPYGCVDACDPQPTGSRAPVLTRYPVGDTNVEFTCRDAENNTSRATSTVRVRDTRPPTLIGNAPGAITIACQTPDGALVDVPRLTWQDNGTSANQLSRVLIVDPGAGERRLTPVPETVLLSRGPHVLRFESTDLSGNVGRVDVPVTVTSSGEPIVEVVRRPAGAWHNAAGDVEVEYRVSDRCGQVDDIEITIGPPPLSQTIDGNRVIVRYRGEGTYTVVITATDEGGNEAVNDEVRFGIDRTPPQAVVIVPSQVGVAGGNALTYPIFARGEQLAINLGGEDEADGPFSGIARVQVVLDPDGDSRLLADRRFDPNGTPPRGRRAETNVGCLLLDRDVGGVPVRDNFCTRDGELSLRYVPRGLHFLSVTVTDFAGNADTAGAWLISAGLQDGADLVAQRTVPILDTPGLPAAVRNPLAASLQGLARARDVADILIEDSLFDTPAYLGTSLLGMQDALGRQSQAMGAADAVLRRRIRELADVSTRLAHSEVELLSAYTRTLERGQQPDYLLAGQRLDLEITAEALDEVAIDRAAEQFTQAAANIVTAYFHAKSAFEQWILDYHYVPTPFSPERIRLEFTRSRDMLQEMVSELSLYLTLDVKPAELDVRRIRDRISNIADRLDTIVRVGIDGDGVSDEEYLHTLLDLRDVANFTNQAANGNAWMRNYQWSMMQVVRFMTHASVRDAILVRGGVRETWPIYVRATEYLTHGVELLDERRVQTVIDLYGSNEDVFCLLIAVYHCDFLDDEGINDTDSPYPEADTPPACWDRMLRPSEWEDAEPGPIRPRCRYGDDVRQ